MRRRSREIPACLILLASAAAFAGCESRRDCVDASGRKLPDSACNTGAHGGSGGAHFVYGGRGGQSVGDTVSGGSTSRGGFGSSGEGGSHGGAGGEGGGE